MLQKLAHCRRGSGLETLEYDIGYRMDVANEQLDASPESNGVRPRAETHQDNGADHMATPFHCSWIPCGLSECKIPPIKCQKYESSAEVPFEMPDTENPPSDRSHAAQNVIKPKIRITNTKYELQTRG